MTAQAITERCPDSGPCIAPEKTAAHVVEQMLRDDPVRALDWFAGRAMSTGRHNIAATLIGISQLCRNQ